VRYLSSQSPQIHRKQDRTSTLWWFDAKQIQTAPRPSIEPKPSIEPQGGSEHMNPQDSLMELKLWGLRPRHWHHGLAMLWSKD